MYIINLHTMCGSVHLNDRHKQVYTKHKKQFTIKSPQKKNLEKHSLTKSSHDFKYFFGV